MTDYSRDRFAVFCVRLQRIFRPPSEAPLRTPGRTAAVGVLLGALLACSDGGPAAAPSPTGSRTPTPTPSRPRATATTAPATVTLAFGGDVHFEGVIASRLSRDPASVFATIAPLLRKADLAVVNLETAVTTRGTAEDKEFTFRAPPTAFDALRSAGVDVVTAANNHGMDFGTVGLQDTLAASERAYFPLIGIGRNANEAWAPYYATIRGSRLAIIAATHMLDDSLRTRWTATNSRPGLASAYDTVRLVATVQQARRQAQTVVVFLHWGTEGKTCPTAKQQALARLLSDAGADVVVGSHAHRLLGAGRLGRTFVAYGLGNFVFYARGGAGAQTGVLLVAVSGRRVLRYRWEPALISGRGTVPLTGTAATRASAAWEKLRDCTGLTR